MAEQLPLKQLVLGSNPNGGTFNNLAYAGYNCHMINIYSPISEITFAKIFLPKLKKLGVETVKDLLWHFPYRYEDFSHLEKIENLKIGEEATIKGEITNVNVHRSWKRHFVILEILVNDETGSVKAVWFNQPYLKNILKPGKIVYLSGKISIHNNKSAFSNPIYEIDNKKGTTHTARIIPIYPETKGLTSRGIRYLMEKALKEFEKIPEIIPEPIRKKINIPGINKALNQIHFPENKESIKKAKKRFSFESLFILQLSNFQKRYTLSKEKAPVIKVDEKKVKKIKGYLPFKLTKDQKKVLDEILNDIQKDYPMNRLLQGDVGSGKTVIAAIISIIAAQNDFQTAFMAPTEILAQQHYETFKKFFEETDIGIALLTSDELKIFFSNGLESNPNKKTLLEKIKKNNIKIVIGTHALIQKNVTFSKLGLVIIDEQHRFGVEQRAKLTKNIKLLPHFLSMTATPIPRTLAITAFGDLNISLITELPKNRKPITTKIVPPSNRNKAYQFIRQEIKKGRQAFVICPRIEPSENNTEKSEDKRRTAWDDVKAVKEEYKKLSQKVFPNLKVEMLHGKLKSEEKEKVMKGFAEGKTNILVSTSVVEIGIDIPNATIMMIEGADRFGLAQLYQFKGRVGRGEHQSYCLLFSDSNSPQIKNRMWSIIKAKNGFELAEKDLKLRGPGEFLGKSQTGIPDIAMESFQNLKLVKESREAAKETIKKDRQLENHLELKNRVKELGEKIHRE